MTDDARITTLEKSIDGINSKLDRLAEMIVSIARVEERIANLQATVHATNVRIGHCEDAIEELQRGTSMKMIERLIWTAISLTLAALVGKFL